MDGFAIRPTFFATVGFTQDLVLLSADGKTELFRKDDMLRFHHVTLTPSLDVFAKNTLSLGGLPAGKYKIKGVIHDKNRKGIEPVEFVIDFEIVGG